jgi:uncharacterized membrane protein YgdD (TMEM256/DUF423 family)
MTRKSLNFDLDLVILLFSFSGILILFLYFLAFAGDNQEMKKVYDTANFYHFVHTMALLAVPLAKRPVLVSTSTLTKNKYLKS